MTDDHPHHSATAATLHAALGDPEWLTPGSTGRRSADEPSIPRIHPPIGINTDVLDHRQHQLDQLAAFTAELLGADQPLHLGTGTAYADVDSVVAQIDEPTSRQKWEELQWVQRAESLLLQGDESAIREEPCPACGCWGLFWLPERVPDAPRVVVCINRHCRPLGRRGPDRTFTLERLASHCIQQRQQRAAN